MYAVHGIFTHYLMCTIKSLSATKNNVIEYY